MKAESNGKDMAHDPVKFITKQATGIPGHDRKPAKNPAAFPGCGVFDRTNATPCLLFLLQFLVNGLLDTCRASLIEQLAVHENGGRSLDIGLTAVAEVPVD
jgi:hypothetical protein